ncbi:MAG: hypothetical protein IKJ69_05225 [Clostridia bacterium]|nr:hypothetical protein [Clostridia bacterium]
MSKKIIASLLALVLILSTFAACSNSGTPGVKNDDEIEKAPESLGIVTDDDLVKAEDVTAITGATDLDGNVVDKEGITDKLGHKIYSTGQKDKAGQLIYTTGKVDSKGEVLYTKNNLDSFGELIYYTGKYNSNGTLVLVPSTEKPDYTTNEKPNKQNQTTTTTTTVGVKTESEIKIADVKRDFIQYFGGSKMDLLYNTDSCEDGGFVTVGYSQSFDGDFAGTSKEWAGHGAVVKYSADGKLLWKYTLGGDSEVTFVDVAELKDESVVAVGHTMATDIDAPLQSQGLSALIVRIDKNGKLIWMYSFPGDETQNGEFLQSVAATPDGGFVVGGKANSNKGFFKTEKDSIKAFIFKFDKNCNLKWRKVLAGSKSNNITALDVNEKGDIYATCVTVSTDGDFAGITYFSQLTTNTVLLKLDKKGNLEWSHYLEGSGNSEYNAVYATSDGGCVVGGSFTVSKKADGIYSNTYGKSDGYVIRYTEKGDVCWARIVGGSGVDYINDIVEIDGGFVVVGQTTSGNLDFAGEQPGGEEDGFVMVLNEKGNTVVKFFLDGESTDSATGLCVLNDGAFVISGWTKSHKKNFKDSGADKMSKGYVTKYTIATE